mmetsp:Transcript_116893/g.337818  ORF Transcript_116893/g.337818 Transcript_116893/m.337818 type:complete len:250 (+) Transcript_116893:627-1376(+)
MLFQQLAFWRAISTSILRSTVCSVTRMFARYRCNSTLANCTNCAKLLSVQSESAPNDGKHDRKTLANDSSAKELHDSINCCDKRFIVISGVASRSPDSRRSRRRVSDKRRHVPKLFFNSWQYSSTRPALNISHSLWNSMKRYCVGSMAYITTCRQLRFVKERSIAMSHALAGFVMIFDIWETISCAILPTALLKWASNVSTNVFAQTFAQCTSRLPLSTRAWISQSFCCFFPRTSLILAWKFCCSIWKR